MPGNDAFTKVLLHLDGVDGSTTITDVNAGGSAHTWTANGSAQVDTAQFKFGGASGLFAAATTDYMATPDSADFTLGAGDFTVDCWFNCAVPTGINAAIVGHNDAAGLASGWSFWIDRGVSDGISAGVSNGAAFTFAGTTTLFTNLINTGWHHVALVRTGNVLKLFIDGIQETADVAFVGSVQDSPGSLTLGRYGDYAPDSYWIGWIDEFRLSVGVARWTANFTPPAQTYDTYSGFELVDEVPNAKRIWRRRTPMPYRSR